MDKNAIHPAFSLPSFYAGRNVFITGATGFLGKVLVEKLLRSCPDVGEIFLLIRPKKGVNIDERLRQMLTNPLFDTLRHAQPNCFDKLIPVEGDISLENLGLSAADTDTLIEKTSIIFHVAANVKFDNTLKNVVFRNVRSTRDICILGGRMKNLTVLLYVSTAYSHVDKLVIDEIAYPTEVDWRKTIQTVEALDEEILEVFKAKYIDKMPNHYVFTKRLAEQIIIDYSGSLPCVICRPSIVTPTLNDPVKGWLDNFNGPILMLIGTAKGILRLIQAEITTKNNYVPVDIVVKALIAAAWKRGSKMTNTQDNLPVVYNCVANHFKCPTLTMMQDIGITISKKIPMDGVIWLPNAIVTTNRLFSYLLVILLHVIPAVFIDGLLFLSGRRPRLLNLQRKSFVTNQTMLYFLQNEWEIRNTKMLSLSDEVPTNDQQTFGYATDLIYNYDMLTYMENGMIGSKIYLLKESMDQLEAAKSHYNRMIWIDRIARTLIGIFFMWVIYGIIV
ncbi:PREDICTED: putative fatty acyl-CoA reductase CG5065 [Dinoponera quadriceps]|uniref:Fatty acyl-CoA reductase n=1 Tax=Dinoponera quadriceps TaxID=609295 RepID=A0A6P3XJK2_DINQU|nr:PREDICTED: putative fatty acyl-CoA reductase CG5065 [Dinoponera quadriceps]